MGTTLIQTNTEEAEINLQTVLAEIPQGGDIIVRKLDGDVKDGVLAVVGALPPSTEPSTDASEPVEDSASDQPTL